MIGARIGTRITTRTGGGHVAAGPALPSPTSLPEAVARRFDAAPSLTPLAAELYQAEAGDRAELPHVVFTIKASPTIRLTSTSLWKEAQLRFEAFAETIEAADDLVAAIDAAFKGAGLDWRGGWAIPLVPSDRAQASARRTHGNVRVFRGMIQYSARYREDR